ncbi:MAG: serine/threonine-protein kinase [Myxococcota bacterium]
MSDPTTHTLAPTNPTRVGSWRVGAMLASGGMGAVFLVEHDVIPARRGVLKVMRPAAGNAPADLEVSKERFHREAEVLSKLRHRGCPRLLDFGYDADGMPFMVQEYVVGETLLQTLGRVGRLSPTEACRVIDEVADVLMAARQLGISHRDVKPENIVLAEDGAVLVDWGIALDHGASRLTQTEFGPGTLAYIGPEEFDGTPADPWKREVYALGVVLVECLSGEAAFSEAPAALVARKLQMPYLEAPAGCSAALVEAIHAATRKDPAERVDLDGLRKLVAGAPPYVPPTLGNELVSWPTLEPRGPPPLPPDLDTEPSPRARRWRTPIMVGSVVVLVTFWLGLYSLGGRDTSTPLSTDTEHVAPSEANPAVAPIPVEAPPAEPTPPVQVASSPKAATPPACTGRVTLPEGSWRLRPRGSKELVRPTKATPCGTYKLMGWDSATDGWKAKKNLVVKEDRVLTCDADLRCSLDKP